MRFTLKNAVHKGKICIKEMLTIGFAKQLSAKNGTRDQDKVTRRINGHKLAKFSTSNKEIES